jgi:hypothetical protein
LLLEALEMQLDPIFVAELMREIWAFDNCLRVLKGTENLFKDEPEYLHVANEIAEHAKNKDRKVFVL